MDSHTLRRQFIDFFVQKHGHTEISSASLVPENDPTVLFTTAGMHPLVPYLMGETHPAGRRLVDSQKCLRTDDIDEVGDTTHLTFFEMLGNWSLGDYFKKESIAWSYEFLTSPVTAGGIGLDPDRLHATCFEGDADCPRDEEAAGHWEAVKFTRVEKAAADSRRLIFFYEKKKNWWGPAGQTGPCGPDSEIFYDRCPELPWSEHRADASQEQINKCPIRKETMPTEQHDTHAALALTRLCSVAGCHPNCECGRYVEIWNNVFMQYNKSADGSFVPLAQQNVDTGLGFERVLAIMQGVETPFETNLFVPLMMKIAELAKKPLSDFSEDEKLSSRIVSDHLRAATFVLADPRAVRPSNTDQGYVLRRLIRRAVRHGMKLGIEGFFTVTLADVIIAKYKDVYPELARSFDFIRAELQKEEDKFHSTLGQGEREFAKIVEKLRTEGSTLLVGETVFHLYDTYGFPLEMTKDLAKENGLEVDAEGYEKCFKEHQEKSRAGASQKFHGGLADNHEETVKLHTATHLLHQALRDVLGSHVYQQGSNITQERLRFDFTHPQKMTPEQVADAEARVNEAIATDVPVHYEMMTVEDAKKRGAIGLFPDRYDERIKVYVMDKFSTEICGGPHVAHTSVLGHFKIKKEESCAAGVRRIKAVVEGGEKGIEFAQEQAAGN
jgi:alanyl-tRNA synthetase